MEFFDYLNFFGIFFEVSKWSKPRVFSIFSFLPKRLRDLFTNICLKGGMCAKKYANI
jgi:hypothetical protein